MNEPIRTMNEKMRESTLHVAHTCWERAEKTANGYSIYAENDVADQYTITISADTLRVEINALVFESHESNETLLGWIESNQRVQTINDYIAWCDIVT
jgi:hypothetical protein